MSQYLIFTLKNKANPEITVELGWLSTTPAREFSTYGIFPYTEKEVLLDKERMSDFLSDIKDEINKRKETLETSIKDKESLTNMIYKCATKEAVETFLEKINEADYFISDNKEDVEDWEYRYSKINQILDILKDNIEKWDLYYSNC